MKTITIGILGAGRIGKLHCLNILKYLPQFRIKTIVDPNPDTTWSATLPCSVETDPDRIFQDAEIQAVLICTPSPLHAQQIIMAAARGLHIFCEKPISTDIEKIKQALSAVDKACVKLQIGFNRRFDPQFSKVKQLLAEDHIGAPQLLRITSRDPRIPPVEFLKSSGGLFMDMTIHDFDMARFLMHSEIEEIYASSGVLIHPIFAEHDDIDTAVINLKFANGCLGVIDNSRQAVYGYDQRVEVLGSRGAVHIDNQKSTTTTLSTSQGIMTEKPLPYFLERYETSFVSELMAFHDCIVNDTKPLVDGEDGLRSVIVSLAAEQSRRENKPVRIQYEQHLDNRERSTH